jgi:hypothetical protein
MAKEGRRPLPSKLEEAERRSFISRTAVECIVVSFTRYFRFFWNNFVVRMVTETCQICDLPVYVPTFWRSRLTASKDLESVRSGILWPLVSLVFLSLFECHHPFGKRCLTPPLHFFFHPEWSKGQATNAHGWNRQNKNENCPKWPTALICPMSLPCR